jgi:hypothetical protein
VLYDKLVTPNKKDPKGKGLMDFDTLKTIIFADPTTRKPENFDIEGASIQDMDKVKVGKFTQWLLKHFVKPTNQDLDEIGTSNVNDPEYKSTIKEYKRRFIEDLFKVTDILGKFEKIKTYIPQEQRDINMHTLVARLFMKGQYGQLLKLMGQEMLKDKRLNGMVDIMTI